MSEFRKDDYLVIKWPVLGLLLSLALVTGMFLGTSQLDTSATAELRTARNLLDAAQEAVDKIAQEEATIIEYIGRYQQLEAMGVVRDEDRLQFLERLAVFRAAHSLFPIEVDIEGQTTLALQYDSTVINPGRPITLRASEVSLSLPLLHEDDMARLFNDLLASQGLLQPQSCNLTSRSAVNTSYIYLAQHFNVDCALRWYTFALPPEPVEVQP